ncbi:OsmC family protein [Sphingobacterium bovistauri]|uniref:OsmC family protein n=1 Tax=Sphingobacterium bovistauri TaxID=2781959 RepID=A0ABS7Z0H9_9SPHI|nr:OsmC family protein [Sphingobacterium bovistauri]MCA5003673.1 OsmC family protein [Sphingobacterium bovistauri]
MKKIHNFEAKLTWQKVELNTNSTQKIYEKTHVIHVEDKPKLQLSAAKAFKGNPNLYNPEDLLLSSLMSCHMMSYLYVCAQYQIEVLSYTDEAIAKLETYVDGSGKIIEVVLNPQVIIKNKSQVELATSIHKEANKLCFIANSCNFSIKHNAICT